MQLRGAAKLAARLPHGAMRNGHAGLRCGAGPGHAGSLLCLCGLCHGGRLLRLHGLLHLRGLRLRHRALGIDGGDILQIHECSWVRAFSLSLWYGASLHSAAAIRCCANITRVAPASVLFNVEQKRCNCYNAAITEFQGT